MKFYTQFSHAPTKGFDCHTSSKTEQQFKFECDINNIAKGLVQSALPAGANSPIFGIKYDVDSYNEALNILAEARSNFEQLPSRAREYFKNDPAKMLEFVHNDNNYDKAVELGIMDSKKVALYKQRKSIENVPRDTNVVQTIQSPLEVTTGPVVNPVSQG